MYHRKGRRKSKKESFDPDETEIKKAIKAFKKKGGKIKKIKADENCDFNIYRSDERLIIF